MRCLVILVCSLLLVGCSNLSLDGLASTTSATAAAAGATALTGSPIAGVVAGGAAGVTTDALIPDLGNAATDFCQANPGDCDRYLLIQQLEKIWKYLLGGILGLVVVAWLIPGPQSLFFWKQKS